MMLNLTFPTARTMRALMLGACVALAGLAANTAQARGPESVADVAEGLLDAVVNISTSQTVQNSGNVPMPDLPPGSPFEEFFKEFFDREGSQGRPRKVNSLGSGFVIDKSGIIVTNNHVIADADEIVANFADGSKLQAELIGRDEKTDLAVLRVKPPKDLPFVEFGDSQVLRIGDWVLAIGNPFGLGGSVTTGIVSAVNRNINAGPYDSFIQTDAAINRGNSGGPLFNMDGKVVGINTAIISPSGGSIGIGFAIPSKLAKRVIDQLVEFGETRRGYIGVRIQAVTDEIAESLGMNAATGALIAGITPGGPADEAGLQTGDIILEFDGQAITAYRDLSRIVADTLVGAETSVTVLRDGAQIELPITLGRLNESEGGNSDEPADAEEGDDATAATVLGMVLGELNDSAREKYGIAADVEGVIVQSVREDSPAAERQIKEGDVIMRVGQEQVIAPADVVAQVNAMRDRGANSALVFVGDSKGDGRFVVLPLNE
ncbi:Do family serine endopeptidase [Tepidamorphus sp. 3E244]|uniref:Do family serine endopeptidase n=1 Tax=Tepidamorphus sp. 3E244 TaxID=3385498 RepID=UPI0038FD0467